MIIKEQVKALWKLCFEDSEEFVEMYFKLRYKNEVNVAIQSGDEVISALQMLPYPMTFCGEMVQTSYISGACTHPDFRSKGVMRELLSQSFARMLRNGIQFSTLIPAEPWLFDYYKRMGYATVFQYSVKEMTLPEFIPSKEIAVNVVSKPQDKVYSYLNKKLSERPCCIQHSAEDFQVIMADLPISGGNLFVAKQANEIRGIAIIYKRENCIIINELLAEDKDTEYSLLFAIKQYTGCNHIIQLLPPDKELPQHSLGMARIINAKEVLQIYASAFPEDDMQLEVSDKQLSVNNGYYYLSDGKCRYSAERLPGAHIQTNISELTEKILKKLNPYMSLMLN
ncbi:GNAT family N-acetyltransferase [uncultured Bacteroides sp.]|jgi:predicted acetyltransferase|uniref:GNAT family N-acetyltransferase n=1 Tax=uncultured Bacteroides sp. TaxID=162156 RepID=UPI00258E5887|nr:GNAT family N-acetyltransferase [uncultured Bacteroides sp.]